MPESVRSPRSPLPTRTDTSDVDTASASMTSLLLLSLSLARAEEIDTLGGYGAYNNNGDMLKLVAIEVTDAVVLTELEFAVYNDNSRGDITFALYVADAGDSTHYTLVDELDAQTPGETGDLDWATSGGVQWVLEADQTYALGVWIAEDWYYFYDDGTEDPWFGDVVAGFRVEDAASVVESFTVDLDAENSSYFYYMNLYSEDADGDDDGVVGEQWGGGDCDDANAGVSPGREEVPYDGIDQDCDDADLADVDGDGADAVSAGGADCDDNSATIAPGLDDACGDDVDADCDGSDCASSSGEEGVKIDAGCGCASGGTGAPSLALGVGLAMAALARARTSRRG